MGLKICTVGIEKIKKNIKGITAQILSRKNIRLSVHISFPGDNLSKHQWIFTKLAMCIDIVEIWFGISTDKVCQF